MTNTNAYAKFHGKCKCIGKRTNKAKNTGLMDMHLMQFGFHTASSASKKIHLENLLVEEFKRVPDVSATTSFIEYLFLILSHAICMILCIEGSFR